MLPVSNSTSSPPVPGTGLLVSRTGDNTLLLFKPPGVWYFFRAAQGTVENSGGLRDQRAQATVPGAQVLCTALISPLLSTPGHRKLADLAESPLLFQTVYLVGRHFFLSKICPLKAL